MNVDPRLIAIGGIVVAVGRGMFSVGGSVPSVRHPLIGVGPRLLLTGPNGYGIGGAPVSFPGLPVTLSLRAIAVRGLRVTI